MNHVHSREGVLDPQCSAHVSLFCALSLLPNYSVICARSHVFTCTIPKFVPFVFACVNLLSISLHTSFHFHLSWFPSVWLFVVPVFHSFTVFVLFGFSSSRFPFFRAIEPLPFLSFLAFSPFSFFLSLSLPAFDFGLCFRFFASSVPPFYPSLLCLICLICPCQCVQSFGP